MKKEIIEKIKKTKWHADWSGATPILDVSFIPDLYFHGLRKNFGQGYTHAFVVYKNGIAQGFLPEQEYVKLGARLGEKLATISSAQKWSKEFVKLADSIFALIELPSKKFLEKWKSSEKLYGDFGAYNEATKAVFDVAGNELSETVRGILIKARRYSETFYSKNFQAYSSVVAQLKKPKGYGNKDFLMMTRQELIDFMENGELPFKNDLEGRYQCCGIYFTKTKTIFLNEKEVGQIESAWGKTEDGEKLTGTIAFRGKVIGKCRVIKNFKGASLEAGEILVTGMTDPNYVPLMKRAGAIITDGGGLLSHAAIVARELKKPCIIGTKIATQVLKDGDLVEVDADQGVVKILKKNN